MSSKLKDSIPQAPKIGPKRNASSSSRTSGFIENSSAAPIPGRAAKELGQETPRKTTKRAQLEAEQKKRHDYAQHLFIDLNKVVFNQGLPEGTKLNWNKRLLTTAGRAKYHRFVLYLHYLFRT